MISPTARRPLWPELASGTLLAAGTIAIYGRTFRVPLLLDDGASIADNLSIRRLWPLGPVLAPPNGAGVGGRPLFNLSLALNYAGGGTAVAGYHLVNLLIHVLAAWTLYALVRRTLGRPVMAARFGADAGVLALIVAALWAWHPVLTESVTYLSQRSESLMGLCYLLTLYAFVRGADAEEIGRPGAWYVLSVLACLGGVATKEVMVTAPVMVLLYDRTFVSGGFLPAWRRHRPLYLGLAATWLPLAYFLSTLHLRGAGGGQGVSAWAYATVECRVVVDYLRLALWPRPLIFDYGMFVPARLAEVWPSALVLAALLAATVIALRRRPMAGFAGAWFFLILAPTSSVVAIIGQPMAENRLYLPLAGIVVLGVLGGFLALGRKLWPVCAVLALVLGAAAAQRNRAYRSAATLWSDTVAKDPANARAHNNLGDVWSQEPGRTGEAIAEYQAALRLQPDFPMAHNNLGNAWAGQPGHLADAIGQYQEVLRLHPDDADAHNNLGSAWSHLPGKRRDAIAEYQTALRLDPSNAEAHHNLGTAWTAVPGRSADAIAEYQAALQLEPGYAEAHNDLGVAWSKLPGRSADAIAEYEAALRLQPDFAGAHLNLGDAWLNQPGRTDAAIAEYQAALRLQPDLALAQANLGNALLRVPGRAPEAIIHYEAALRAEPDQAEVRSNLGYALMAAGRPQEAIAQYEAALRLRPDLILARLNLAVALLRTPAGVAEAEMQLEAVLRQDPGNEPARQIRARLRGAAPQL